MKVILGIFLFVFASTVFAQNGNEDVIYLNNGNVVEGKIIDVVPNISVKIRTENGSVYEYKSTEIRQVKNGSVILPEASTRSSYVDYNDQNHGYWWSAELSGGPSVFYDKATFGHTQIAVINGYRFNEFFRAGIGLGIRYYIDNNQVRSKSDAWSFPVYADIRGNFISQDVRRVVPYWSVDMGGAIRDGFFFSPTIGIRAGGKRSNMLVGISYTGQSTNTKWESNKQLVSFLSAKIGFEF